jgi:DNA polymerase IV
MRHIAHLEIPDFYAALEELRRPELKERPLALSEQGPRAVVVGVNGIARSEGIREGMPFELARRMCRRLLALPPDLGFYREQHGDIVQELDRFSPLVEGTFPGRYFVDLTGTRRLWGPDTDVSCRMERELETQRGLSARVGLASNKLVSQVAASCVAPGDLSCIYPGWETSFLAPLPVVSLPGIGPKTASRLADFNIQQIGQLAVLSPEALSGVFGKTGLRLLKIARGIDITPVLPFQRVPRLNVVRNLDRDEIDRERLEGILFQQAEEAGWLLRTHNRYPGRFALEVRYADGNTVRSQQALSPITTQVDYRLFRAMRAAFDRTVKRRIAIRRIVLELSDFSMPLRQMSFFAWEEASLHSEKKLQEALDAIRLRFGRTIIQWGKATL